MLRSRIIPCLLLQDGGLVKTTRFTDPKYVGDPLNAVRIFNEKKVDELIVIDITATLNQSTPNYDLISSLAAQCRMPLCYGGGITELSQVEKIVSLGVEKVALGHTLISSPEFIKNASRCVGSQSIVAVIDVKKTGLFGRYEVVTHNAQKYTGLRPADVAKTAQSLGVGEILINSVDRDGTMLGYDFDLIDGIRSNTLLPITVLGGAGSNDDLRALVSRYSIIGASAGSLFVFKGKYRAVLIQYPSEDEKHVIFSS